jgi:hypothetical protein
MGGRFLEIYLVDHHAGSTAGLELAKRAARSNRGTPTGDALERLVVEIDADRATLQRLLAVLGRRPSKTKDGLAWSAERLGRLKLNGQLRGYSPLSRLNELEGLSLGVAGKRALWEALRAIPEFASLPDFDFAALSQRAETQLLELETLRREAAAQALRM